MDNEASKATPPESTSPTSASSIRICLIGESVVGRSWATAPESR